MSWRALGSGGVIRIRRSAGSVITSMFSPWHVCLPE
ncbi:hypothetical protein Ae168Ps1_6214c [Pseudonocardia sp. Ae168_Ps1]|nr:hypothetical protein Ae168Ps1_6214c [Pseudonocardia sp. Ae168_Ps1]OLL71587.1 hypothetical protein Ae263Ps1_6075c [Pseudonocardia sp. Ae263_Ps1]